MRMAILAVPADASQKVAEVLAGAGVTGILNMTFSRLKLPANVKVVTIDAAMELSVLPYYMNTVDAARALDPPGAAGRQLFPDGNSSMKQSIDC